MNLESVLFGICLVAALVAHASRAEAPAFEQPYRQAGFLRGNTHTHTNWSDGDSAPDQVIKRYKDLGYDFVVVTDHNRAETALRFTQFNDGGFLAVPGEEITYWGTDTRGAGHNIPVHVNGLCMVRGEGGKLPAVWAHSTVDALHRAVDFTRGNGAVAQINHPNYFFALDYDDINSVDGPVLMEIANQHQAVQNDGDANHPSVIKLWDRLLSDGKDVYGVASDDEHALNNGHGDKWAKPGKGWVQVAAESRSNESICDAMSHGKFYSSTGVALKSIEVTETAMAIEVEAAGAAASEFTTKFIGKDGKVLSTQKGLSPRYSLQGGEGYVRAVVRNSHGKSAWSQASRLK